MKKLDDVKAEGAALLAKHRRVVCEHTAIAIAANPARALALGRDNVTRSASSFAPEWKSLLLKGDVPEICTLLLDLSDGTEQMRISQPFSGHLPVGELREISRLVYGDTNATPP